MHFLLEKVAAESLHAMKGHTVKLPSKFLDVNTRIAIYQIENKNRSKVRYEHWYKTLDSFLFLGRSNSHTWFNGGAYSSK